MANLACLFKKRGLPAYPARAHAGRGQGYLISGSDLDTFGPSAELLKTNRIDYFKDHNPNHIKIFKPDITVIGNAIKRGNPSLEYILNNRLPYCSMPEIIKTELLPNKKPIVITGTSGKTTTTAITAWILKEAGLKPTALVGGIMTNLNSGFLNGNGEYVVIEGDEYNSSFFDSCAKFLHYQPYIGAINNVQMDHLDIYGNIENIVSAFKKFVKLIPLNGVLVLNQQDEHTPELIKESKSRVKTFGPKGNIHAKNIILNSSGLTFSAYNDKKNLGTVKTSLFGKHNVDNILTAIFIGLELKIPFSKITKAITSFKGVKRRLEVIYDTKDIKIIDDFAHNPEKVLASLSALRGHFPKHQIIAIFEPRTGSSRRKFFQDIYPPSFKPADIIYIAETFKKSSLNSKEAFSNKQLALDINKNRVKAYAIDTADKIITHIKTNLLKPNPLKPRIFCIMTSGEFDGIHKKLTNLFK